MPFSSSSLGHLVVLSLNSHLGQNGQSVLGLGESSKGLQGRGARFLVRRVQRQRPRADAAFCKALLIGPGSPIKSPGGEKKKINDFVSLKNAGDACG